MSLRTRLILTLVAIILLMAAPSMYAASRLLELRRIFSDAQRTRAEAYLAMGKLQTRLAEYDRLQRSFIITGEAEEAEARDTALAYAMVHLSTLQERGYTEEARPAAQVIANIARASETIDSLMQAGATGAATTRFEAVKLLFEEAEERLDRISAEIRTRSDADIRDATIISTTANTTTLISLGAGVLLALALGAWITRNMVAPIIDLRRGMARVTGGDLHVPEGLPYDRPDEIGDVSRSFRTMTGRLAELDKLRAEFMSISTHELKTPINVISGYAELLHEQVLGNIAPKQRDALDSIREQTRVLTHMVNQLLDVSRIEAGGMRLEIQEVAVRELFERVYRTFKALARKQRVNLRVQLSSDSPDTIPGDADRLRDQVLGNLISNALKFTPEGGRVSVRGRPDGDWMVIEVEDTGAGIPQDQLHHVFDKFFQVGEQARSQGAGLGLTIAHEVVTGHAGQISAESEPGVGTCFRIRLPLTLAVAERAQREHGQHRERALATGDV